MNDTKRNSDKVKIQDEFTSPFSRVKLFKKGRKNDDDMFGIEFEESREISSNSNLINQPKNSLTQKSDDTISGKGIGNKKTSLFGQKKNAADAFDVSFEMSHNLTEATFTSSILTNDKSETFSKNSTATIKRPELFKNVERVKNDFNSGFDELSQSQTISQKSEDYKEMISQDSTSLIKCKLFNRMKNNLNDNNNFDIELENSCRMLSQESTKNSQQSQELLSDSSAHFKKPKLFKNKKSKLINNFNLDIEKSDQKLTEDFSQGSKEIQLLSNLSQKSDEPISQNIEKEKLFKTRERHIKNAFDVDFEESKQCLTAEEIPDGNISNVTKLIPFNVRREHKDDPFDIDFEESNTFNTPSVQRTKSFSLLNKETSENFDTDFDETNLGDSVKASRSQNLFKVKEINQDYQISLNKSLDESESVIDPKRESSRSSMHKEQLENLINERELSIDEQMPEKSITDVKNLEYLPEDTKAVPEGNVPEVPSILNESSFNDENLNVWTSDRSDDELENASDNKSLNDVSHIQNDQVLVVTDDLENQFQLKLDDILNNARKIARKDRSEIVSKKETIEKSKEIKDQFKNVKHNKKPRLAKPASFANKRLYQYIMKKIKPKFGLDYALKAEEIVIAICEVVKIVNRRKSHQKKLINDLKLDMAKMGLIETTFDFHEFVRNYLPYEFREKVVPCIQPGSNIIYPPKDAKNPFDKILA